RAVADTLLYEGYVLYPYRASAKKNQVRFQFGVVAPRAYAESVGTDDDEGSSVSGAAEPWRTRTECLLEPRDDTDVTVLLRFLQLQARTVEERTDDGFRPVAELAASGSHLVSWDEAVEQSIEIVVSVGALLAGHRAQSFSFPSTEEIEDLPGGEGRVVRRRWPLSGRVILTAEELPGPYGVVCLRLEVENRSEWATDDPGASRDEALRRSLLSAHSLLGLSSGHFISLLDPPEWARQLVAACENRHTWPVLMGGADVVLSSPIILYDQPEIASESPGDLYDALEIDDILSLRTMTLSDEEKQEARATDPRAAAIIDRVDTMSAEILSRLHGALRSVEPSVRKVDPGPGLDPFEGFDPLAGLEHLAGGEPMPGKNPDVPWWDPGADSSVDPDKDSILVGGVLVSKGSRVKLRPGRHLDNANSARRHLTDGQDLFYDGRIAIVQGVFFDVDGAEYLAVSLEDMPDVDLAHGRFLYFNPAEVEPLEAAR
ncbi:MAG TPA: hypothetical protein VFF24_14435, partial [Acidimicrobiia bacterium]|nr:hypothetical protein [Acidimicrobiia bacterium]